MSTNPRERISQPPNTNTTPEPDRVSDTRLGNPNGDEVDNSAGAISVDGRSGNRPIRPTRQQSMGASLANFAKAPNLAGVGMSRY